MKLTFEKLETTGYIVVDRAIEAIRYDDYLIAYGSDETTSPRGVKSRIFMRENEGGFEICTWGTGGNNLRVTGEVFETEQEAELCLYEYKEYYVQEKNWDAPCFFYTEDEAIKDLAETLERNFDIVKRAVIISRIRAKREAEQSKEWARIEKERQAIITNLSIEEANAIVIDEVFKSEIIESRKFTSYVKNKMQSSAFTALLQRLNYGKINSDFWKVFKLVTNF